MQGGRFMNQKIFWEKNSRIKGIVPKEQIIDKTQTHKFPCEAVTIRMYNVNDKNPSVTAYFHGKEAKQTSWSGTNYIVAETKLMVSLTKEGNGYNFNGSIIDFFSLQDLKEVLDSVRETLNKL
jgi:hypothetical protein